jgi:hypothetical protein
MKLPADNDVRFFAGPVTRVTFISGYIRSELRRKRSRR